MEFGFSLESINLRASGPNKLIMQSKTYWVEIFKCIASVGYKSIEMPYNPYTAEPLTFEIGRCGDPISKFAIDSQYGGAQAFRSLLDDIGINHINALYIKANDTMLDCIFTFKDINKINTYFLELAKEAIDYAKELSVDTVLLSPVPEQGYIDKYITDKEAYKENIFEMIQEICKEASEKNIKIAVKNEFWSILDFEDIKRILAENSNIFYSPDFSHMYIAKQDVDEMFAEFSGRILAPRLSDTEFTDVENNKIRSNPEIPVAGCQKIFCDMGEGKVDFVDIKNKLAQEKFDDIVVCDCKRTVNVYRSILKNKWYVDHVIDK